MTLPITDEEIAVARAAEGSTYAFGVYRRPHPGSRWLDHIDALTAELYETNLRAAQSDEAYHRVMSANDEMKAELKAWHDNAVEILKDDRDVVRMCEGGAPESLVGSIAITMIKTRKNRDEAQAKVAQQDKTIEQVGVAVGSFADPCGGDLAAGVDLISMRCASAEERLTIMAKALKWYSELAASMNRYTTAKPAMTDAMTAVVTEMSLDAGSRAAAALSGSSDSRPEPPAEAAEAETDDDLRRLWREAGGRFFGPRVETGAMPEERLLPFLRSLGGHAGGGVVVKPLVWAIDAHTGNWWANSPIGQYTAWDLIGSAGFRVGSGSNVWAGQNINEAKAAAQADYESRIRAALAPNPSAGEVLPGPEKQLDRVRIGGGEYVRADEAVKSIMLVQRQLYAADEELKRLRATPPANGKAVPVAWLADSVRALLEQDQRPVLLSADKWEAFKVNAQQWLAHPATGEKPAPAKGEEATSPTCPNTGLPCVPSCNQRACAGLHIPLNEWPMPEIERE